MVTRGDCEMRRRSAERQQRDYIEDTLKRMIREDCKDAIRLGFLSKTEAVDIARRELAAWEFETD